MADTMISGNHIYTTSKKKAAALRGDKKTILKLDKPCKCGNFKVWKKRALLICTRCKRFRDVIKDG